MHKKRSEQDSETKMKTINFVDFRKIHFPQLHLTPKEEIAIKEWACRDAEPIGVISAKNTQSKLDCGNQDREGFYWVQLGNHKFTTFKIAWWMPLVAGMGCIIPIGLLILLIWVLYRFF